MSRTHPTLEEISVVLADLGKQLAADRGPGVDPIVLISISRALDELKLHIPGLEPPTDLERARGLTDAARDALGHGKWPLALARVLRGLSFSPHDPELHYTAAVACFELGAAAEAIALLQHALWINPGHPGARRDLEALSAFCEPGTTLVPGESHASGGSSFELPEGEWEPLYGCDLEEDPGSLEPTDGWPPDFSSLEDDPEDFDESA